MSEEPAEVEVRRCWPRFVFLVVLITFVSVLVSIVMKLKEAKL